MDQVNLSSGLKSLGGVVFLLHGVCRRDMALWTTLPTIHRASNPALISSAGCACGLGPAQHDRAEPPSSTCCRNREDPHRGDEDGPARCHPADGDRRAGHGPGSPAEIQPGGTHTHTPHYTIINNITPTYTYEL